MEVSGEAADLVMKEGVQISEEAIKLLARGAKNLAALLYALAKDQKKLYGKVSMGVVRSTYIIDEKGVIETVMPKVKPDTNAAEILKYLRGENEHGV